MTTTTPIPETLMYPKETSRITEADLDDLLLFCVRNEASDITLQTGDQVVADIHGRLRRVTCHKLSHSEVDAVVNLIYGANGTEQILAGTEAFLATYLLQT